MAGKGKPGPAPGTKPKEGVNRGNAGKGRPKGCPNKVTAKARETIQALLDGNANRLQEWLDAVAETDPKAALASFTALIEFGVPKLARTELTGKDGGEIQTSTRLVINGVEPDA